MRSCKSILGLTGCAIWAASSAMAQPSATDLGTLSTGTPVNVSNIAIGAGEVVWYTFSVNATVASPLYLDIDSEGSLLATSNDTEIGIYTSAGNLVVSDDDDGSGLLTQISFGQANPPRPAFGSSQPYNGRDGTLAAGTYYLSISGFNTTFGLTNWTVTSTSNNTGSASLNIVLGEGPPPPPGTFIEESDAGELPGSATTVGGSGALSQILGTNGGDADMFLIDICDAANFSATTAGGATHDTQIWLFNTDGTGLIFNDDESATAPIVRQSTLPIGSVSTSGQYYLAISGYNRDPVDASSALLWNNTPFDGARTPDGPGAANPVASWTGTGAGGSYAIALTGACFVGGDCPGDVNGDGSVGLADLATLLANFGTAQGATLEMGDLDGDGDVDLADLATLLANFGATC